MQMIKAIVRQQTFLFCVVFEWEVFERSYYKSFCSYHFRNMRFENPVPFLCKSVILGVMTTYAQTYGQGAKALGKCVVSLFKEGEGKIVTYTFFLSHFIAFPCLDFCSVNSITCTLKVTVLPVIALAVATNLFLYSNYAQSMKGIRCDWGQQVVLVDSNSQCALLQSWKLSFPIKPSRIWKLLNGEYILQRYPYIFRQT